MLERGEWERGEGSCFHHLLERLPASEVVFDLEPVAVIIGILTALGKGKQWLNGKRVWSQVSKPCLDNPGSAFNPALTALTQQI